MENLQIDAQITIPASDLEWTAARSSGPGGQNVNKVATRVLLRFDLPGTQALSEAVKARLRRLARGRLDAEGRVLLVSQGTRSQERNLSEALEKLRELVLQALVPPVRRVATRPTLGSKLRRVEGKRLQSEKKQQRAKPPES